MEKFMNELSSFGIQVLEALSPVLLALISWGALKLSNLIQAKVKNEKLQGMLMQLDHAAEMAVKEIEQTFVSNLDSTRPAESMKQAKEMALQSLKNFMGPKGLIELADILGVQQLSDDFEHVLSTKIESKILDLKTSGGLKAKGKPGRKPRAK
jgi:hypothetical protein